MNDDVKLGRLFLVENKKRNNRENLNYYAIQVEAVDGKDEECLLFTEKELNSLPIVDSKIKLVDGRLYPFSDGNFHGYLLKTTEKRENFWSIVIRKLSMKKYINAHERAQKNPEDITRKSWITDIFD